MEAPEGSPRVVRFGVFELDRRTGELRRNGGRVRLQEQPLRILGALLAAPGELVTREELRRLLWPEDTFVDFENGLNRAINRLRAALGDAAQSPRFIETLERRGYRFIAPVSALDPPETAAPEAGPRAGWRIRGARWTRLAAAAVAVVSLLSVGLAVSRRLGPSTRPGPPIRRLAVLPLANLTGDPAQEYFSDGMTDALITRLASVPALHVISRQSVTGYKASAKPLPQIARELGVEAIVEGTVVRSGGRVRVTAQLVHATRDRHLWAQSYDRDLSDVLKLQAEIAAAVAAQVQARLGSAPEKAPPPSAAPVDPRAYEAYLRGRFNVDELNPASLARAVDYFEQARAIDPTFAPAYEGIARAMFLQEFWGARSRTTALAEDVRRMLWKALELDPDLAEAHDTMGRVLLHYDFDWRGAEEAFRRAVELEPGSVAAHDGYSLLLQALMRYDEALAEAGKAVALDPLSPMAVTEEGRVFYRARRYAEAEERYLRALRLDPGFGSALDRLVQLYLAQGRLTEARQALKRLEQLPSHRPRRSTVLGGRLEALAGNAEAARRALVELPAEASLPRAGIRIALGDHDGAFEELERGVESRVLGPYIWANPELDPLRRDPRFARLVQGIGLPVEKLVALGPTGR